MPTNLFILGSPGSGKSTACRIIQNFILPNHSIKHIKDYNVLKKMFLAEQQSASNTFERFRATEYDGFNVLDLDAFDEALQSISQEMRKLLTSELEQFIMVEFSRNDYQVALGFFDSILLQDAYFLFIEAQEKLCRERLHERVKHPQTLDDHFVSDYILDTYYSKAVRLNKLELCEKYGIKPQRFRVLSNDGLLEDFTLKIEQFAAEILLSDE